MKSFSVTGQVNATEQYFPVVLVIVHYNVDLTIKYVDKKLKCDQSRQSY